MGYYSPTHILRDASPNASPAHSDTMKSTPVTGTVPDILARIVAKKREDLARATPLPRDGWEQAAALLLPTRRDFRAALAAPTTSPSPHALPRRPPRPHHPRPLPPPRHAPALSRSCAAHAEGRGPGQRKRHPLRRRYRPSARRRLPRVPGRRAPHEIRRSRRR